MIEINLVPDIKQEFLRSQRLRAKVTSGAILVSLAAGGVVVFLALALGTQGVREVLADNSIKDKYNKLVQDNPDLNNIATIQQQLAELSSVNDNKQVSSRLFDLLVLVNPREPNNVQMNEVNFDPATSTIKVDGMAGVGSFNAVDAFKKTILNTKITYTIDKKDKTAMLATDVKVGKTSLGENSSGERVVRFDLSFKYPKDLFSNKATNVRISTPTGEVDVTDSRLRVPDSLFAQPATDIKEEE
jgi:hypothetical protein